MAALLLVLSACSATDPARVRDGQPAAAFPNSRPVEDGHRNDRPPARVRRDAYGRPIRFREIRLDRHGAAHCAGGDCGADEDESRRREDGRDGDS